MENKVQSNNNDNSKQSLNKKLLELQKAINPIGKDSNNPFFKSSYFDINKLLEVLKPELNKVGIVIMQPLTTVIVGESIKPALKTTIMDSETGDFLEETIVLPENADPQKMGSTITYFRRYALQSLLLLQAQDDDGNLASGASQQNTPQVAQIGQTNTVPQQPYKKPPQGQNIGNYAKEQWSKKEYKCTGCGAEISEAENGYSFNKYGKALCQAKCQKLVVQTKN
jgi:DNA-directed RNA polymerase subunit RPC12/RpoP